MGDIVGRLFREFAITLAVTILVLRGRLPDAYAHDVLEAAEAHAGVVSGPHVPRFRTRLRSGHCSLTARCSRFVLRWQTATLIVAVLTLAVTGYQFYTIPKGFFPIQDTGVIQGVTEAVQTVSFPEMSQFQQRLAKIILTDPAVENLSSFIGIDGTNTTLNSGRILINLKPLDDRKIAATEVIRRLQPKLAQVAGITLFMQPVQDLTVEDRVSRTQFQYTLEDPNADELNTYAPQMVERLKKLPMLTDVATDQQLQGLRAKLVFDRDTACAGHFASMIRDQDAYDAYGQRSLHYLHAAQSVSRAARSEALLPAESGRSAEPVYPHRRGIRLGCGPGRGRFVHVIGFLGAGQFQHRRQWWPPTRYLPPRQPLHRQQPPGRATRPLLGFPPEGRCR